MCDYYSRLISENETGFQIKFHKSLTFQREVPVGVEVFTEDVLPVLGL